MLKFILPLLILFSLPAAALDLKPEWTACTEDSDCKAVSGHCGTGMGVNREYANEVIDAIEEEILEKKIGKCDSYASVPKSAVCKKGTCEATYK